MAFTKDLFYQQRLNGIRKRNLSNLRRVQDVDVVLYNRYIQIYFIYLLIRNLKSHKACLLKEALGKLLTYVKY